MGAGHHVATGGPGTAYSVHMSLREPQSLPLVVIAAWGQEQGDVRSRSQEQGQEQGRVASGRGRGLALTTLAPAALKAATDVLALRTTDAF